MRRASAAALLAAATAASSLGGAGCGSQATLTPEIIAQKSFDFLKADNFSGYFTSIVATKALVLPLCPMIAGFDRYFDSGEGSERQQNDAWVACRAALDFTNARFVSASIDRKSPELVSPECAMPVENVDVVVTVNLGGGATGTYTVHGVMNFTTGWRAYHKIKSCSTTPAP